jgi:hypothetical protein
MITDVKSSGVIVRTANKIVELGFDGVQQHIKEAKEQGSRSGNHFNAYMQMSLMDYHCAKILVDNGLGESILKRMGVWGIDKFTYFTKSNKWLLSNSKTYRAKGLEDFINRIVKADKK